MKEKNIKEVNEDIEVPVSETDSTDSQDVIIEDVAADSIAEDETMQDIESLKDLLAQRDADLEKEKKEYLFLMAEFDNFKKRTLREKAELLKNGGESALKGLLPIIDDFERGLQAASSDTSAAALKEGMELIYNKFIKYLKDNGVEAMESTGAQFDDNLHEAIALVPSDDPSKKGVVIDTLTKGYTLNGKVIRHAKVAVAQ